MKLLREITAAGAANDYLFARIRCRRAALDLSGAKPWGGGGEPQELLRREYLWVYRRMNARLRRQLLPVFEAAELRTLVLCLRYLAAEDYSAIGSLLKLSLLHPLLQRELRGAKRVTPLVATLERLLAEQQPEFRGLSETYLRQGPGGLEQALIGGHLQRSLNCCRLTVLKEFLRYLLDSRNLLAIYKHLRWQVPSGPPLLAGGDLSLAVCEKLWRAKDLNGLLSLIKKFSGQTGDPEQFGVEDFIFQGLSQRMHRAGRDPLQPGLVIDYLWRCQQATRKRGLRMEQDRGLSTQPGLEAS